MPFIRFFSGLTFKGSQASQLRQGLAILRDFNKVFTANYGQVQFNDVVLAGINLMNNFGISATRLPSVLNRMQASVRFGATNMSAFVSSLSQVVPAYRAAHYSFTQLAKDVAFVSRLFPQSLRTGTTGLARLSEMFARPNVIQGIQQQFHVDIAPRGQLLPLNEIIQELVKAKPDIFATSQAIGSFFKNVGGTQGTIQARRVLAGFVQEMGLYHTVAGQVGGDNNELTRSFRAMQQTPGVRLQEFFNQLRGIVLELGAGAIPAFRAFVAPIEAAVRWFDQLNPRTQQFIGHALALAGILGLLVGTFLAVAGGLGPYRYNGWNGS
jgi:TP901 family phage tail tape measure protein